MIRDWNCGAIILAEKKTIKKINLFCQVCIQNVSDDRIRGVHRWNLHHKRRFYQMVYYVTAAVYGNLV